MILRRQFAQQLFACNCSYKFRCRKSPLMKTALSAMALPCQSRITHQLASTSLKPLNPKAPAQRNLRLCSRGTTAVACYVRPLRSVEDRFRIQVERNVDESRLQELNVKRWSKWEADLCAYDHEWKVDEQVYIAKGSVRVTPEDCDDCTYFYAGDLVRFPKWFSATLSFEGDYEQRYRFLAYGDD